MWGIIFLIKAHSEYRRQRVFNGNKAYSEYRRQRVLKGTRPIQNTEDNGYLVGIWSTLESVPTSANITGIDAQAALLMFNLEVGFFKTNIDSFYGVGRSTKKGQRHQGFIGEKGRVIKGEREVPRLHQIDNDRGRPVCATRTSGILG